MLLSIPVEFTCCKKNLNSILMPVSICTQKEFLIESKLNGFWGVLLLLLDRVAKIVDILLYTGNRHHRHWII